jgi:hypothetical protein
MGRSGRYRLVHRTVIWAHVDFPGELSQFPAVHHRCAVRICVNPQHLAPATALINNLEQSIRNALLRQISQLEGELRLLVPGHPLLLRPQESLQVEDSLAPPNGQTFESASLRIRRRERVSTYRRKLQEREEMRFRQVVQVRTMLSNGRAKKEALAEIQMSRSAFDDWNARLTRVLNDHRV